ncbi:site-specific integrase [Rhizobium hidalgonense]|uniref:Site-specific integrase n=1 Tax=Rhizobium hidalgonense TaxID=1538159 RepID=A0AAJ2LIQ7_9HYPH|nr:site-specific integrase [Rhizobium hidalgonense]MDR9772427.1 site-specific integrase [Rhizobium hidalgonense]
MLKVTGLQRRGSTYSLRRRVPSDLVNSLGKKEEVIALHTSNYKVAAEAARLESVRLDKLWANHREALKRGEAIDPTRKVTDIELRRLVVGDFWRGEQTAPRLPDDDEIRENIEHDIAGYEQRNPSSEAALLAQAKSIIREQELPIEVPAKTEMGKRAQPFEAPRELVQLVDLIRRADVEHLKRALDRMDGQHGDREHDPMFRGISSVSQPPAVAEGITLRDAIKRFESDPMRAHLGDTANAKYVVTFRTMKEVIGEERALASITRAECATVQEMFSALPSNVSKLKPYAHCKTVREIIALAAQRKTDKLLSPGTVKVYTHTQSAFFNWAISKGLIAINPASGMAPKNAKNGKRRAYDFDQMNNVLASLPEWSEQGALAGRYWLYIIGIFSGMRLGEIATLNVDDIVAQYGSHFFRLWETDDRGLKTENSERIIPIHPELIRLGLLQRVANLKKAGITRLFGDLPGDDQDHISDLFSKRFAYHLKTLKMHGNGLTFHSTRHTFRDALREAGLPHDATVALGGWSPKSVDERYGNGMRPQTLVRWMAEIKYEGLMIPMIDHAR